MGTNQRLELLESTHAAKFFLFIIQSGIPPAANLLLASFLGAFLLAGQFAQAQAVAPISSTIQAPHQASALRIAAGDLLDVQVFDTAELSGKLRVSDRGEIVVPVAGSISVDGLTAEEAAARVERILRDHFLMNDPHVSVFVQEYATQGVSVLGEVKSPGVYPLQGAHGLLDLISAAGGVTATSGKAVSITHKGDAQHAVVVQLDDAPDLAARADAAILPGDIIVVPRSGVVYAIGDLVKPGGFLIETNDRLTVLQAVALAQGTNRTAKLNQCRLIRKTAEGRKETPVELKKIFAGSRPDIRLENGDILFVPSSEAKNLAYRGLEATIGMATGIMIYSAR
jgi:polysaccharide export outer membrane protein